MIRRWLTAPEPSHRCRFPSRVWWVSAPRVGFSRRRVLFGPAPIVLYTRTVSRLVEVAVAMPDEDEKRAAHRALVDRVLNGEGKASPELRARAFSNTDLPVPLQALIGKVATSPAQVTDADFAAAKAAGFSEDQLCELVISAAVGQSTRLYEAALAALAEATGTAEADDAT